MHPKNYVHKLCLVLGWHIHRNIVDGVRWLMSAKQHIKSTKYIDISSDIRYPTNNDQCVVETDQGRNEKLDVKSCLSNGINTYLHIAHTAKTANSVKEWRTESGQHAFVHDWESMLFLIFIFFFTIYDSAIGTIHLLSNIDLAECRNTLWHIRLPLRICMQAKRAQKAERA